MSLIYNSTMAKCKPSSFCILFGIMLALLTLVLLYIFLLLGKGEDGGNDSRQGFFIALGIVLGLVTVVVMLAIMWKLLCNQRCKNEKFYLSFLLDKGQSKLIRTKHFSGSDCCICLDKKGTSKKAIAKLKCGHEFHEECISKSFSNDDQRCPMCRQVPNSYSMSERFVAFVSDLLKQTSPLNDKSTLTLLKNDGSISSAETIV